MTLKTAEGTDRAWHLVKLMEADYGEKMVVPLLKIELLSASEHIDENEYYNGKLLTDAEVSRVCTRWVGECHPASRKGRRTFKATQAVLVA